jgi:hypothetical protein
MKFKSDNTIKAKSYSVREVKKDMYEIKPVKQSWPVPQIQRKLKML